MKNTLPLNKSVVLIRGGGELASGVAWTLAMSGYRVVITEIPKPLMVRWPVCFGTAVAEGVWQVEGVNGRKIQNPSEAEDIWKKGEIPVLIDPELTHLESIKPDILIDAIIAKRNLGTSLDMAPFTIGLGPGFKAGEDVHLVIETNRGHNLGRLIYSGAAEPNTGVPGLIGGYTLERVIYSPQSGTFHAKRAIGEYVKHGEILGEIENDNQTSPVISSIDGTLRGLLRSGTYISKGVKSGDIDPRAKKEYCWTISEKARSIGSAALLAIVNKECHNTKL